MADVSSPVANKVFINAGKGVAPIKEEFLIKQTPTIENNSKVNLAEENSQCQSSEASAPLPGESRQEKKRKRGQNKNRPRDERPRAKSKLCPATINEVTCPYGEKCKFSHDVPDFWASKPADLGEKCPVFEKRGKCKEGVACRYAGGHVTVTSSGIRNVLDQEKIDEFSKNPISFETNDLAFEVRKSLLKRTYDFTKSDEYLTNVGKADTVSAAPPSGREQKIDAVPVDGKVGCVGDAWCKGEPKKQILKDWAGKLYLAPLTTVGNLPFRRICVDFGAEITCGEMALAIELIKSNRSELALIKRHSSEKIFGVQVCGGHVDVMTRCAQLLTETTEIDFIDINMGCPIDMICQRGAGCSLMTRAKRFEGIIDGMNSVMGNIPLTVKMRTGFYENKNNAHSIIGALRALNAVSSITVHGRSREQRYTKLPDWSYINECAKVGQPIPVFGCGDILSYDDYYDRLEQNGAVAGAVLARGALIKPWIFTEIKERRHWDISSTERLDILKSYANYGLEHWGSDQQGVDITRRFLLEWLSFLHRYIPVGILERLPQKINERPAPYFCRDELETRMASHNCQDWIKLTEIMLGPVSESFQFLPKHKANAY